MLALLITQLFNECCGHRVASELQAQRSLHLLLNLDGPFPRLFAGCDLRAAGTHGPGTLVEGLTRASRRRSTPC